MATGRTLSRWTKVYLNGYTAGAHAKSIGPLITQFEVTDDSALEDSVKGGLPSQVKFGVGTLNALDSAGAALFSDAFNPGTSYNLMIPIGIRGTAAAGDPTYCGRFYMTGDMQESEVGGFVYRTMPFGDWDVANLVDYQKAWGTLIHAYAAETGANSSGTGVDDNYLEASTAFGGYMAYAIFAGNGTATIKVQHSVDEVDGNYADLGGCTSGVLNCVTSQGGIVKTTAKTTTVNRYLRWQLTLGTATTVTFALAFVRSHHATT